MPRFSRKNWKKPKLKGRGPITTKWGWTVSHPDLLKLGMFTDLGCFVYIQSEEGVIIEDYVQIGGGVKIYSVNTIDGSRGRVIIRRNAKIGANSVILPNVEIGQNSLICSLSLVNRSIPPNEVWMGVPAKLIKQLRDKRLLGKDYETRSHR